MVLEGLFVCLHIVMCVVLTVLLTVVNNQDCLLYGMTGNLINVYYTFGFLLLMLTVVNGLFIT